MHPPVSTALQMPDSPGKVTPIDDLDAVAGVLGGNREMFEVIVRRYNTQLYRVGMAYLHDHAQTEDAMQDAYLKAFLNLKRFRGNSAFSTWLTRIMINECLMILRSRKRFVMENFDEENEAAGDDSRNRSCPEPLHRQELKAALEEAIRKLPRGHRTVYLLREVQQLSIAETAACLGISPENVKVSLHRARERLKTELMKSAAGVELFDYTAIHCDPMTAKVMKAIRSAPLSPGS